MLANQIHGWSRASLLQHVIMAESAATFQLVNQIRRAIVDLTEKNQEPVGVLSVGGNQAVVVQGRSGSTAQAATTISNSSTQPAVPVYSYKVKIINPAKKSDVVVRQIHNFTSKFESVTAMRVKLIEELTDHVPNTIEFDVGYYDGTTRLWTVTQDDIDAMYLRYKNGGAITLWCVGRQPGSRDEERSERNAKRKRDKTENRQEKEEEVDDTFQQLLDKHGKSFDTPKLRLWSRMICSGIHDDYDSPPDIPAFTGAVSKRHRNESLTDALTGAAVAFAQSLHTGNTNGKGKDLPSRQLRDSSSSSVAGFSPSKAIDLRMKNLEQLRYLQKLFDDGILSKDEFSHLKQDILTSLQKL